MNEDPQIPVLTDLIEKGIEITITDLGLDDEDLGLEAEDVWDKTIVDDPAIDPLTDNSALEHAIRRILDEHMELALNEIKLVIRRELNKS